MLRRQGIAALSEEETNLFNPLEGANPLAPRPYLADKGAFSAESPKEKTIRVEGGLSRHLDITSVKHYDVFMRTTLTGDDGIATELRRLSASSHRGFKNVVNEMLRRGLAVSSRPLSSPGHCVVKAKSCGFLPGVDPLKLNELSDEIETDEFIARHRTQSPSIN